MRAAAVCLCLLSVVCQLPDGAVAFTSPVNPGFRTILTQNGLNYGSYPLEPLNNGHIGGNSVLSIIRRLLEVEMYGKYRQGQ